MNPRQEPSLDLLPEPAGGRAHAKDAGGYMCNAWPTPVDLGSECKSAMVQHCRAVRVEVGDIHENRNMAFRLAGQRGR
jgi:hypothetical protein